MLFKHYTVYKTTNNITSEIYIGSHKTMNINDSYLGSGSLIKEKIKEYGKENFSKEILFNFDNPEDMSNKEREIVNEKFIKNTNNYNLRVGGGSKYDRRFADIEELDYQIEKLIKKFTIEEICEKLEIKVYRVNNFLVKRGLSRKDIYSKPKLSKEDKRFIRDSYKEVRVSVISSIIKVNIDIINNYIQTIHPNFKFNLIYKKDLLDLYIRKELKLKEIANSYNCSQANLTIYMKKYNIYEIKNRLQNIIKIREIKGSKLSRKEIFMKYKISTSWLVKYKIFLK
jgi:hypothetical protein